MKKLAAFFALVVLTWALPAIGWAHAYLVSADPPLGALLTETPEIIKLSYSEAIEPQFSGFALYDAEGRKIAELESVLDQTGTNITLQLEPLADGIYTLAWRVVSAVDGHLTKGTYPVSIGIDNAVASNVNGETKAPALNPFQAFTRWLEFLAAMLLVGGVLFALLVLGSLKIDLLAHWLRATLKIALALFAITAIGDLFFQASGLSESSLFELFERGILIQILLETRYGHVWLIKMGLVILLGLWMARRDSKIWVQAILGALLLLVLSLSSHSAALADSALLAIASDWGHLTAASFWVGGLLQFALLLIAMRALSPDERKNAISLIAPRFYQTAFISAALVLLTGFHLTYRHIPDLGGALFTTAYGEVFLVKHLVVLVLVLLAAGNLIWIWPRSGKASLRILRLEAIGAAVVVFLGTLLTLLPPPDRNDIAEQQSTTANPILLVRPIDNITVALVISPGVVGMNTFDVYLTDFEGQPVADAQRVTLTLSYADDDLGNIAAIAQPQGDGHYKTQGSFISLAGNWEIQITARFAGRADDLKVTLPVRIENKSSSSASQASGTERAQSEMGSLIFQEHCASCHGSSGRGDGPEAASLPIPPVNLGEHMSHHSDESLKTIIQTGRLPVMKPFGAILTEDEIEKIISFLRTLKP